MRDVQAADHQLRQRRTASAGSASASHRTTAAAVAYATRLDARAWRNRREHAKRPRRERQRRRPRRTAPRSEEHTSELQSLMRISYAVFCLKKKHITTHKPH